MSLGRATCQLLGNRSYHGQSLKSYVEDIVPSGPHGGEPPGLVSWLQTGDTGGGPATCLCPCPRTYPGQVPTSAQHPGQHCPQSQ